MHAYNRFELESFGKMAADAYLDQDVDLNTSIMKMAQDNGFNNHQIERVVENANILVNGTLVKQARSDDGDPRVSFPLADSAEIKTRLNAGVHKIAEMRKVAAVQNLFTVPRRQENVIERVLGKMASDPYASQPKSIDHVEAAGWFVREPEKMAKIAGRVTTATLSLACQTLEDMKQRALTDHSLAKVAMDESEAGLRQEINDQLLSGMSPATVRAVVKSADLDDKTAPYVDGLVTKVAAGLRMREGQSAFGTRDLVNKNHPLITKAAEVMGRVSTAVTKRRGLDKLSSAHQAARVHYAQAVREGR
jgi:hypothetical protein